MLLTIIIITTTLHNCHSGGRYHHSCSVLVDVFLLRP